MKLSVIVSTYNSEEWLAKVLEGYCNQYESDFELVIADDGSTAQTQALVNSYASHFRYPIVHVWQEDNGFQKCKILNKAILAAHSDYLLFTDGDCIPRADFVAQHLKYKKEGHFLSGGYFKLPLSISKEITFENIMQQDCFSMFWLLQKGMSLSFKLSKLVQNNFFAQFMNWITPTKKTFNGHNTSCFKKDLLAVNGFNEAMKYGGLDRELGERLTHYGIVAKQIRYAAICLHLDHSRAYFSEAERKKNTEIRNYNKKHKVIRIANGIEKL
jgi:glycosyltransferase involved in cell wall biosynthesis